MNYLTDHLGKEIEARNPLSVRDIGMARDVRAVTNEAVTFKTGAASFKGIITLDSAPIMNPSGSKVGSFWRDKSNLMAKSGPNAIITALTETDGSAAVTIIDLDNNLEQLFEVTVGDSQYVMVVTDPSGDQLYGFIRGVATTGNSYVVTINNTVAGGTANWIGSQSPFDSTDVTKLGFEVYSWESSVSWGTGTILTQEVQYSPGNTDAANLRLLATAGDYSIDYARGRVFYRKATTGTSDTITYKTVTPAPLESWSVDKSAALEASTVTKASSGVLRSIGGRIDSTHATATYYLQVYNAASLPADGAVTFLLAPLKLQHVIGTDTNFNIDLTNEGVFASTGIVVALSTTEFTKTISGAFLSTNILYR